MTSAPVASTWHAVAVLGVVRHLASACEGYLVVNGEYTPLDGVPDPDRAEQPSPTRATPPRARAFVEAFLTRRVDGEAGWSDSMNLLRDVSDGRPELPPRHIQRDQEWRPFQPTDPIPEWWPLSQYLLTPQPYVRWHLRPGPRSGAPLHPAIARR